MNGGKVAGKSKKLNECMRHMAKTKAAIFDLDDTLIKGNALKNIGMACLKKELVNCNLKNFLRGIEKFIIIKNRLRNERTDDNALYESLRIFYDALIETGIREREMRFNAKSYIEKNIIKNTAILARNFDKIKIISTMSGSTVAKVAAELVNFQAFISNEDIFDNTGKLVAAAIIMKNGETKAEATSIAMWQRGIRIKDCTVIVNGYNDIPLLFEARKNGLVIASPYAVEEVKKNADIVLSEKEDLIEFKR